MKQLNERQESILLSLKRLDFLNRDQLQRLHRLGKVRNANRILSELSLYLQSFREGYQSIYYLSKLGREYVDSQKVRRKNQFVNHVIMRNDYFLHVGAPSSFKNEIKLTDGVDTVIVDAIYKKDNRYIMLEVDSTQKMKANREKVNKYKSIMKRGAVQQSWGYFPHIVWLTTTELRRKQLKELCKDLPCEVYTIQDIK
ncbi:hypothetical protein BpsS36_00054 [Bacillus phage vB_BpsS-36]|uniref:Replication-relaxation n=1 Tax=Bacillus phage vB_BpsS-36 TaxID=2419622 RepID=A0A3G3BX58_9CAUD|nr:hypothetical protein BpsS36_00054 [Bacillus phage vB_BpsS-36]